MALPIQTPKQPRLYTFAEFLELPEYYERFELIHGKLVEKPMGKYEHTRATRFFIEYYVKFDPDKFLGEFNTELNFRLDKDYAPTPDVSYHIDSRRPPRGTQTTLTPDFAIEVQSVGQSLISLTNKGKDYIKGGVRLVWIIQPEKRVVKVMRPGSNKIETYTGDDDLDATSVIPGFIIKVNQIFE